MGFGGWPLPDDEPLLRVQTFAQLLAGLEEGDKLLCHVNAGPGARIAADAGVALLDGEGPETPQFDPVATSQRLGYLVENGGDDLLDIPLVEVRVLFRKTQDQLRLGHRPCFPPVARVLPLRGTALPRATVTVPRKRRQRQGKLL